MKRIQTFALIGAIVAPMIFTSCEGCVQKTAKKVTDIGFSVADGISESLNEHGEKTSKQMTDGLGSILKGAGKSVDEHLNAHAAHVASIGSRTFVQMLDGTIEGFGEGFADHYDVVEFEGEYPRGVALKNFGRIKGKPVLDAYFYVLEKGAYDCTFNFVDADGKVLLTRESSMEKNDETKNNVVVSLALDTNEEKLIKETVKAQVKVVVKK
ncbi:hypothetical protein [Bacteroides sp. 224]|uniref:hypothetical protein n=1 Tax=Bacteroides sp. 224 TaxID=2302936 RepID=UPI0013D1A06D|nr:hypothetical protein [Bacteroides sp. 224]NDV66600.1 hypothetical protein [Bacteroides sp. 224]